MAKKKRDIKIGLELRQCIKQALRRSNSLRHQFVTPEAVMYEIFDHTVTQIALHEFRVDSAPILRFLKENRDATPAVPEEMDYLPEPSFQLRQLIDVAIDFALMDECDVLEICHFFSAAASLDFCTMTDVIRHYIIGEEDDREEGDRTVFKIEDRMWDLIPEDSRDHDALDQFRNLIITVDDSEKMDIHFNAIYERTPFLDPLETLRSALGQLQTLHEAEGGSDGDDTEDPFADLPLPWDTPADEHPWDDDDDYEDDLPWGDERDFLPKKKRVKLDSYVTCINDQLQGRNPLIGREQELDRTIHVLCRKDKNNPLHVGEPGVGKTALVYGLAQRISDGLVPDDLKDYRIYRVDMAGMLAGTQYRGDFEKRLKSTMDKLSKMERAIVYIDEIHTIVGTGANSENAMDASNMLKPYLESGRLRFIGSTTYEEFNRYILPRKGIVRRFQQIDIAEPTVAQATEILMGLKGSYEKFHRVTYHKQAIEYAVTASAKHITGRFLPDKAIDLIDEAGAYLHLHPRNAGRQWVTKDIINEVLLRVMKINAKAMKEDDNASLKTLGKRMGEVIFGQDEAVRSVVEAVHIAKAGLVDDNKPMASLLFVGPTGVGKTEVARALAAELGVELVRFDMSEYTEKHTVAKLIGSPAGYVGYDDGGLLTAAIRKTPNCILLLDEIEKAHEDIYNILLQVMDYARLTDNKGNIADFRNVILIMTSNAGAQYAGMSVGFDSNVSRGGSMLKQVKKTFKPEFINRLSNIIVFNDMTREMAQLILDKKMRQLQDHLDARKVTVTLSDDMRALLLKEGFSQEYGARELDRVIHRHIKTPLVKEILFGRLRRGGKALVTPGAVTIKKK